MRYFPTNYLLHKRKITSSQNCTFCMIEPETIEHLFFKCHYVRNLWLQVFQDWNSKMSQTRLPSMEICILGHMVSENSVENVALYNFLMHVKAYIKKSKLDKKSLSSLAFKQYFQDQLMQLDQVYSNNIINVLKQVYP